MGEMLKRIGQEAGGIVAKERQVNAWWRRHHYDGTRTPGAFRKLVELDRLDALDEEALRSAADDHRDCRSRHGAHGECPVIPTFGVDPEVCEHGRWNPDNDQCLDCGEIIPRAARKAAKLSPNMIELLTDVVGNGTMYVRNFSKWGKTAGALKSRGLVNLRWCDDQMTAVTITTAGAEEARRRKLVELDRLDALDEEAPRPSGSNASEAEEATR
jgi:hypothetical protein